MDERADSAGASVSERIAAFVAGARFDDLPAAAVERTRTFVLDTIGVGIAGAATPASRDLRAAAAGWGTGGAARAWGTTETLPPASAALVSTHQAHCLEFDCVHEGAVLHPLTAVLPCLVADAQRRVAGGERIAGRDLLLAACLGVELAGGIGVAATTGLRFFRPATAGVLAATCALARFRGLDERQTADALGIAYSGLSGTMQPHTEGSGCLALQFGFNARAALTAVDLVEHGGTGPRRIFEGPYGYYTLIEAAGDPERLVRDLGTWQVLRVSHKPFPAGRATHAAIGGTLQLLAEHGFTADDVVSGVATVPPLIHRLVSRPATPRPEAGTMRLSLPFQVASCLIDGDVGLETTREERLLDPRVLDLASRIRVEIDPAIDDPNGFDPQTIAFALRDGTTRSITLERALGTPENPLDRERQLAKFRACLAYGAPDWEPARGERLLELLDGLDGLADIAPLLDLV